MKIELDLTEEEIDRLTYIFEDSTDAGSLYCGYQSDDLVSAIRKFNDATALYAGEGS